MKSRILLISFCLLCLNSYAKDEYQTFKASKNNKISANIGSKSHNRISLEGANIYQVIGDDRLYKITYSAFKNHFFLIPKPNKETKINLSVITNSGKVVDLDLSVRKEENGKTIIISFEK